MRMGKNSITFELIDKGNDNGRWKGLAESIPSANVFHTEEWLDFVKNSFSLEYSRYIIKKDGKTAGILPVFTRKSFLFGIAGSPLIAENNPYMGWALNDNSIIDELIPSVERFLRGRGIGFLRLSFDHFFFKEAFEKCGYELKEKKSFRLDLSIGEDAVWKNMDMTCRNKARKGEKGGCVVREITDSSFVEPYYLMSSEVYGRQGITTLVSKDYYDRIFKDLYPKGLLKVFMAYSPDNKPIAGAIVLVFKKRAYYLDGVSFREYSKLAPGNFLQWHIIRRLIADGVASYDMLGGDMEGIAAYKKSYGAVNHPALYAEKSFGQWIKMARNMYTEGKKIKKRLAYIISSKK